MGNLDEIRLWDVALSENEINNWMCVSLASTHPNYTNLMGYWNLNEGIGSYTDDQTANGNNGTLFGGTTWQVSSSCLSGAILCGDVKIMSYTYRLASSAAVAALANPILS